MTKRLLSVLLAGLLLAGAFALPAAAEDAPAAGTIDGLEWTFDGATGKLTVTGEGKMKNYTAPAKSPFYGRDDILSVEIGRGVANVGSYAFYGCKNLKEVSLPKTLDAIGIAAFGECASLTGIELPNRVTTIAPNAFRHSGLTDVTVPKNVSSVGSGAFADCGSLERITVAAENKKFANDKYGVLFARENGANTELLQYPAGGPGTAYVVPATVTAIAREAFSSAALLEAVTLPAGVETIGVCAFNGCASLARLGMGGGELTVAADAFGGCDRLTEVYAADGAAWFDDVTVEAGNDALTNADIVTDGAFGACGDSVLWFYNENTKVLYILGDGKTSNYDFDWNLSPFGALDAEKAVIGKNVSKISDWTFFACKKLAEIAVEPGSAYLTAEDGALYNATKTRLIAFPNASENTALRIPEGVTEIAAGAANNAGKLRLVTIPGSMGAIHYAAFENCTSLREVYYGSCEQNWNRFYIDYLNEPLENAKRRYTMDTLDFTLNEPVTGQTPPKQYAADEAEARTAPYASVSIAWDPADGAFKEGAEYTVTLTVTPRADHVLPATAEEIEATVNGAPAACGFVTMTDPQTGASVAGVQVRFTFAPARGYTLGDIDDEDGVTAADARLALRAAIGLEDYAPGSRAFLAADADRNGAVNAADARLILRRAVGFSDPEWGE